MNVLSGEITSITEYDNLSLVDIKVGNTHLSSVIIETSETAGYLKNGHNINVLFKETEVIISKNADLNISLQNRIPCTISKIVEGKILSRLALEFNDYTLTSIITTHAVHQLNLKEGEAVVAMVKTNEIMLSE